MIEYIYNDGTSAHRGVWHIAEGPVEIEEVPERVSEHEGKNCKSITVYPAHKKYKVREVLCHQMPRYGWGTKNPYVIQAGGTTYSYAFCYREKPHKEPTEHKKVTQTLDWQYKQDDMPSPLCSRCGRKAGVL